MTDFFDRLPFAPDKFQIQAARHIDDGTSVVVTAPTGAGKTVVAEYGIDRALRIDKRAFYTTPIKALSNQKFTDLKVEHGEGQVGLLTGDNVINGDAPIIVMTTEVLRNMIYSESSALDDLGVVILDEVHYLQDRFRGQVWEEVIIHLPSEIQLVCLSATIANAEEFRGWVEARRGNTELVVETHRPVPLVSEYMFHDRHRDTVELLPILKRGKANPEVAKRLKKGRGRVRRFFPPRRVETVETLAAEGLLPAIVFVFSRAGCEAGAQQVGAAGLGLVTPADAAEIQRRAEEGTAHLDPLDKTVLGYERWVDTLKQGVAAHHAGMVPAFKETVEDLFTGGLLKVVFATETLALGINMPARTVVIEKLSKFTGETHEMLRGGDYTQLTGRAGRRGIDTAGTAVVLHSPHVPFEKVAEIAAAGSHQLRSSFQPTYNMAANLIANYPQARAEELLNASFAQFRSEQKRLDLERRIADLEADLEEYRKSAECDNGDIWTHVDEAGTDHHAALRDFVQGLGEGDVLEVEGDRAVVMARGYGASPRLLLLSSNGLVRTKPESLGVAVSRLGTLTLPTPILARDDAYQGRILEALSAFDPAGAPATPAIDGAVNGVAGCPQLGDHRRWVRRAEKTEKDLVRLRRRAGRVVDGGLVGQFRRLLKVLEGWGYTDGWALTPKGEKLRFVYNEMDVAVVESVAAGIFEDLTPEELAAVISMFVFEPRGLDEVVVWPSQRIEVLSGMVTEVVERLNVDETRSGLTTTRMPNGGFTNSIYHWTRGAHLEDLFDDDAVAGGDFVRNCRQVLDLVRQIRDVFPDLADTARTAIKAIDRGVVAAGGQS
ncbi:MAG: DEAD/DEAH box helicase [Acidimicrobiia bacterium]|nr:DEAD/DEAH box helicase [Acidimicrobiia bacterium]